MPQISVIIPVYNVEKYLRRCIDSVLTQTFKDFELLLIDDGSPDSCGLICDEYAECDERVKVIHTTNMGVSAARNTGIEWAIANSDSKWLAFIDSDDWIHPQYLEILLDAAIKNNTDISVCGYVETEGDTPDISQDKFVSKVWAVDEFFMERKINAIVVWAKLCSKESFSTVRYPIGKRYEDEFTLHKILFQYEKIAVVDAELYYYYTNPKSFMNSTWSSNRLQGIEAYEERIEYFKKLNNDELLKFDYYNLIRFICAQLIKINTQDTDEDRLKYEPILRRSLRENIKKYKKIPTVFSIKGNEWIYELAYPKQMKIYWILNSLKNKFIKKSE